MTEEEFRKYQIAEYQKTLEEKVERWKQLQPTLYDKPMPELMFTYSSKADQMFINGHFIGVILLCAAVVELCLADQLMSKPKCLTKR